MSESFPSGTAPHVSGSSFRCLLRRSSWRLRPRLDAGCLSLGLARGRSDSRLGLDHRHSVLDRDVGSGRVLHAGPIRADGIPRINLEPYRIVFGRIALVWLVVLLTDPRAQFHRTVIDIPLLLIVASVALSVVANPHERHLRHERHQDTASVRDALRSSTSFAAASRQLEDIEWLISVIVASGTLLAALAVIESATGYNVFNELHRVGWLSEIPGKFDGGSGRGGATRAFASSSHPIALGVVFATLFPLAGYLAQRNRVWLLSVILLPAGVLGTVSRTPILMLVVIVLLFAALRPAEAMRLLAVVGIAAAVVFSRRRAQSVAWPRRSSPRAESSPSSRTPTRSTTRTLGDDWPISIRSFVSGLPSRSSERASGRGPSMGARTPSAMAATPGCSTTSGWISCSKRGFSASSRGSARSSCSRRDLLDARGRGTRRGTSPSRCSRRS